MKELELHQFAFFFKWPVDPYELKLDKYWEVVKRPMDLLSIEVKILQKIYKEVENIKEDIELMINNALKYFKDQN